MSIQIWMVLICIISKFYCILLMAKANSFKSEPWTALEKGEWSIFEDDFVHEKLFTLKATRKSPTSTIALKETLTQKDNKISTADELKVWFPFRENRTLYARVKNDGFKLHYDHGFLSQNDLRFNFYGSVQGKRTIGNLIYKIGVETQNKDLVFNWRLRYNNGENGLAIYNKTSYTQQRWNIGLLNVFDVFGKAWNHSALQLGWKSDNPKNLFYLRLNAGKKYERVNPSNYLNAITFDFVHRLTDNSKLAVQLESNLANKQITNTTVAWEHKCSDQPNTAIKVKGDTRRNVSFSVKNNLQNYGNYIFGVHIHEFGGQNRFSYGVQLDLSL